MHFFKRFLDLEFTNLAVKMIENVYLAKVLDLFLTMPCPNWVNISDRVQTFADGFANIGYHAMSASKVQINCLKNHCFPKLVDLTEIILKHRDGVDDDSLQSVLSLVYRQNPTDHLLESMLTCKWTADSVDFVQDYAKIAFLCGLSTKSGIVVAFSNESNFISEPYFLRLTDLYAAKLHARLFPLQATIITQVMRELVLIHERTETSISSTKDLKDEQAKIRQKYIIFYMAITLLNLYNTQFDSDPKMSSLLYSKLGTYTVQPSIEDGIDFTQALIQHMETISLSYPFLSSVVQQSVTSVMAIYELGFFNTLKAACHSLFTLFTICKSVLDSHGSF